MKTNTIVPIHIDHDTPLVDTRVIADRCGVEHRSLYRLLNEHAVTIESTFGRVRFQIAPLQTAGGKQNSSSALLTEDQATFLITLTRNTAPVIAFKAALVAAFSEAKKKLASGGSTINAPGQEALRLAREFKALGASPDAATKAASEIVRSVASRRASKANATMASATALADRRASKAAKVTEPIKVRHLHGDDPSGVFGFINNVVASRMKGGVA